jgi:hypothetical protein
MKKALPRGSTTTKTWVYSSMKWWGEHVKLGRARDNDHFLSISSAHHSLNLDLVISGAQNMRGQGYLNNNSPFLGVNAKMLFCLFKMSG